MQTCLFIYLHIHFYNCNFCILKEKKMRSQAKLVLGWSGLGLNSGHCQGPVRTCLGRHGDGINNGSCGPISLFFNYAFLCTCLLFTYVLMFLIKHAASEGGGWVSLCIPGYPRTWSENHAGLELRESLASTS